MNKKQVLLIVLILGFTVQFGFAESVTFKSNSKSEDGAQLKLTGILNKPKGNGPFPAIVLLHGFNGFDSGQERTKAWSDILVDWGYVTLQLDNFELRGGEDGYKGMSTIIQRNRVRDVYDTKAFLGELPYVDPSRIALIGWSYGGNTVHEAIENTSGDRKPFRAAVAFHPNCRFCVDPNTPLMILIGELDDWTPAYRCTRAIPPMPTEHEIHLKIYPGAYHDFDWQGMDMVYRGNRLKYDAEAAEDAIMRVQEFLAKYVK